MKINYIILVVVLALTSGCVYFDYGVSKDDPQLLPTPNVSGHELNGYQFWSIISNDPNVDIKHASFSYQDPSIIQSTIRIGDHKTDDITIQAVVLEHRDKDNNLIRPAKIKWAELPVKPQRYGTYFEKTYDKSSFPIGRSAPER